MRLPRVRFTVRRVMVAVAILTSPALSASAQDHLIPERGTINEDITDHVRSLRRALLKDDHFNPYRARVFCIPSFKPAWVITLVCEGEGADLAFFVEYAEFDGRAGGGGIEEAEVRRVRTPLVRETAETVQMVWLTMLRGVRYPRKPTAGADGATYHFSRFVRLLSEDPLAPAGWEAGQTWAPDPASLTGRLVALAEALRAYSLAPREERDKLQKRILQEAVSFKSDLDAPRPTSEKSPE